MIPAAHAYAQRLEAEIDPVLAEIAAVWATMGLDFDAGWQRIGERVVDVTEAAQVRVATMASKYVPEAALATIGATSAAYQPSLSAWAGTAGDGRPVSTLAAGGVVTAREGVKRGLTVPQALIAGGAWLQQAMRTVLTDTHRGVEQMEMHARGVTKYVRMISGHNTCGRCIILAGREYRTEHAFERHPNCMCTHVPVAENVPGDVRTNPGDYLDSLDDDELARVLGSKANAEAYRDGADVNQIINAYRRKGAVQKAQMWGRNVSYTTEGMTRRGWAYKRMAAEHNAFRRGLEGDRKGSRTQVVRLMPSSIYEMAKDRDDALRLLRIYGWTL